MNEVIEKKYWRWLYVLGASVMILIAGYVFTAIHINDKTKTLAICGLVVSYAAIATFIIVAIILLRLRKKLYT